MVIFYAAIAKGGIDGEVLLMCFITEFNSSFKVVEWEFFHKAVDRYWFFKECISFTLIFDSIWMKITDYDFVGKIFWDVTDALHVENWFQSY